MSASLPTPAATQLLGWDSTGASLRNYDASALGIAIATASWRTDKFNGTGAQTTFVLTSDAGVASNIDLMVNNVPQVADVNFSYTSATKTITFLTGAPGSGTNNVVARYGSALPATGAVTQTSQVGAAVMPTGATGQRDTVPSAGYFRFNTTLVAGELYNGSAWDSLATLGKAQSFTAPQRAAVTTANTGAFDCSLTNNFSCTPTGTITLTPSNLAAGQSGYILLVNGSNYSIAKAASVRCSSVLLTTISATGTYLISYYSDGSLMYITGSAALS